MALSELGLIGNCQLAAHVRSDGAIVWCCMPRFDSAPVFGALLDDADGGSFVIGDASRAVGRQRYVPNTNVLETRFEGPDGSFRVLDFAPRFVQFERSFRPTKIVRIVEPPVTVTPASIPPRASTPKPGRNAMRTGTTTAINPGMII